MQICTIKNQKKFTSTFDSGARIVDVDMTSCVTVRCS